MIPPKDILFVIDNMYRELGGIILTSKYLEDQGASCAYCTRYSYDIAIATYKPKIVIFPHPAFPLIPKLSEEVIVAVIPSESGNGDSGQITEILAGKEGYKTYHENVDIVFSWGDVMTSVINKNNFFPSAKVLTTGSPNNDHWYTTKMPSSSKTVGIATTLRSLGKTSFSPIPYIYKTEKFGEGPASYYVQPEHIESWIFWEASFLRVLSNMIDHVFLPSQLPLSIRPHPFEHLKAYYYFRDLNPNLISVERSGPISSWFDSISSLITYMSTSALDAIVRGVPVISMKGLLNQDALNKVPQSFIYPWYDFFWQAKSHDELKELLISAQNSQLGLADQPTQLNQFLFDAFRYPQEMPSSYYIATHLLDSLKESKRGRPERFISNLKKERRYISRVTQKIPGSLDALSFLYLLDNLALGATKTHYPGLKDTYVPWRRKASAAAALSAENVYRNHPISQ